MVLKKFRECTTTHIIKKNRFEFICIIYLIRCLLVFSVLLIYIYRQGIPILFSIPSFCYFYNAFVFILYSQLSSCFFYFFIILPVVPPHTLYSQSSSCFFYFFIITCCTTTPLYFPSFLFTNSPSIPFRLKIPFPFITLGIALPSSTIT